MSDSSLALALPQPVFISIVAGPDRGVTFKLLSQKISLGRERDNDISLKDERCSRHHATLEFVEGAIFIRDTGSQNGVIVNGKSCRESFLNYGDIFILGNTHFQIQMGTEATPTTKDVEEQIKNVLPSFVFKTPNKKTLRFIGIVSVIVLLAFALFSGSGIKRPSTGIRSDEQVQTEIEATQTRKEELSRLKRSEGQFSQQYIEAQAAFIQGFRDYREGNYGRAIQSFTAALALYPNHELALRYKKLSILRLGESIQYSMFEAKRYMEQNKYEMAKSSYKNVMISINDPNDKTYREAKERYEEIELLLTGKF